MSDNLQHDTPQGSSSEGPTVKRPCMNDTPPIASTPADDGSNFYNTPLTGGTPVPTTEVQQNTSNPPAPIPGLSLVKNDPDQTVPSDSGLSQAVNATATVEGEKQADMTTEPTGANAQDNTQAMDVQQDGEQTKPKDTTESGETANDTNAPDAMEVADGEGEGEPREWETDSSPYESSSDDSSTDSSDDDSDDDYPVLTAEETARILMQAELGSDDEGDGKGKSGGQLRTANEIPDEAPPLPEITITPEMKVVFLGQVEAIVENTILIAANTSGEYQVLESGSILCLEDRTVAGVVSETLGRVENPLYAVRYPDAAIIADRGISKGTNFYYVEEKSTFVFTQPLKGMKGSDASNFHDEEIPEDEVEFSDDEAEAEFKKRQKQKRQEKKGAKNEGGRAQRGPPGPSKLAHTELNYDDNAGDEGYTPLARPKNLHEMMGPQEAPVEKDGPSGATPAFRGGRGRGRGSDRGRGAGRGRGRGGSYNNDRQPSHQHHGSDSPSQPTSYQQQAYPQNPQPPYPMNPQFPSYPYFPQAQPQPQQQQPQQPFAQGQMPAPFNFQMPFQQAFQQPNPYQQMPHINPLFLAALQQQQQQQQQQHSYQQPQQPGQPQAQSPLNFDQVKAQLDLLRHLSNNNNNQGPPPS